MKKQILLLMTLAGAQLYGAAGPGHFPSASTQSKKDWRLISAVREGNVCKVNELLRLGVNLNERTTPLTDLKYKQQVEKLHYT